MKCHFFKFLSLKPTKIDFIFHERNVPFPLCFILFHKLEFEITDSDDASIRSADLAQLFVDSHPAQNTPEAELSFIAAEVRPLDEFFNPGLSTTNWSLSRRTVNALSSSFSYL